MQAVVAHRHGGPDVLELTGVERPEAGPGSVLVRVKAAGVNPVDWHVVAGHLNSVLKVSLPLVPGFDVAGVVEAVGPDVTQFAVGDEVFGYVRTREVQYGTYAEFVAAPVETLARKPAALDWRESAGLPLVGLTALQALDRVNAGAGETVLVHAAAGGVGSAAVQIAVARGARVIGTASERNHDFLRSLGAEPVVYGDGLAERVRDLAPEGVDVAFDCIGGDAVAVSQKVLKDPSRVVSIVDPQVAQVGGHHVFTQPVPADLAVLAELADSGRLGVHVDQVLPLGDAAEALRLSRAGRVRGKIVLDVG
ncbi:NADP-dependent oxidoreductase [Streptomyces fuscichromogenes]|uniref:NADP-dependent oxidoreductase n=1 Tax=Streptomyces fuscichromogenes TaxID=1324013 RepID=UPI00382FC9A3